MEKVKLPKEIAEAVQIKFDNYSQEGMAYMMLEFSSIDSVISNWIDHETENIVKLSQFLVDLYKTVQSPEDKVREYAELLRLKHINATAGRNDTSSPYGDELRGCMKTLDKLGITLEGVNI